MDRRDRLARLALFGGLTALGAVLILTNLPSSLPFRNLNEAAPILIGIVIGFAGVLGVLGAALGDEEAASEAGPDVGQ